jgi:hypothetical protein
VSKWNLPTQKGTTAWPQATRSPVKVRFDGVPAGSELARLLYHALQGPINRFYWKAAQAYALSPTDQSGLHQTTNDWSIRYLNNQGHETLIIKVAADVVEGVIKQLKRYWDYAIIEVRVPNIQSVAEFAAFIRSPRMQEILPTSVMPLKGVAKDDCWWEANPSHLHLTPDRTIAYPDFKFPNPAVPPLATNSTTDGTGSLRIDLRPFRGLTTVIVDLYAHIGPVVVSQQVVTGNVLAAHLGASSHELDMTITQQPEGPPDILRLYPNAGVTIDSVIAHHPSLSVWASNYYVYANDFPEHIDHFYDGNAQPQYIYSDGSGWLSPPGFDPNAVFGHLTPNVGGPGLGEVGTLTYFSGTSYVATNTEFYCFWHSTVDIHNRRPMPIVGDPPPDGPGVGEAQVTYTFEWGDFTEYYIPTYGFVPVETYPIHSATVHGFIAQGAQPERWDEETTSNDVFFRWQDVNRYPDRWGFLDLGETTIIPTATPVDDLDPFNKFDMQYIGTVTIDLVVGGISFKAAP